MDLWEFTVSKTSRCITHASARRPSVTGLVLQSQRGATTTVPGMCCNELVSGKVDWATAAVLERLVFDEKVGRRDGFTKYPVGNRPFALRTSDARASA